MDEIEKNVQIKRTHLGKEDHGIPSFMLVCKWDGSEQGFGGYDLRHGPYATLIFDIMDAVGVESWERLAGQFCRVKRRNGTIVAIGHIVEDRWVDMDERQGGEDGD